MKMIFIFIDGLGLGSGDPEKNPFIKADNPNLDYILKSFRMFPTDACLGVMGLPQSATGQTAIFTGVNASSVLGRHLNGQPTVTLINIINENNLFRELLKRGLKVTNANAYRREYLEKMLDSKDRRHRPSVTSVMCMAEGVAFRTVDDYIQGNGVYHDITGQILLDSGYSIDKVTPEEAARRLYSISRINDFTLFEHFISDIIGHKGDMDLAIAEIETLDAFLGELIRNMDMSEDAVIITSDHGNIEDISVKTHTFNKVPTILIGKVWESLENEVYSLTDIMPAVLNIFDTYMHNT